MKLVLLPGMDGTGRLFGPLLSCLHHDAVIIPLPQGYEQDYDSLSEWLYPLLPDEDFVLLAESFSGPLGARVAADPPASLRGIIFVATFLSPPHPLLLQMVRRLPLSGLARLPLSSRAMRGLFLGWDASAEMLAAFRALVTELPDLLLQQRIAAMQQSGPLRFTSNLPALYIRASRDRLVPGNRWCEYASLFSDLSLTEVNGPHFVLQSRPGECAAAINGFVDHLGEVE